MRYTRLIILLFSPIFLFANDYYLTDVERVVDKTQKQFEKASDYQVIMKIELKVPGFRMPKKKYKVFFKQPNKLKIKSRGFGMLPKTGIFTSPKDNFDEDTQTIQFEEGGTLTFFAQATDNDPTNNLTFSCDSVPNVASHS